MSQEGLREALDEEGSVQHGQGRPHPEGAEFQVCILRTSTIALRSTLRTPLVLPGFLSSRSAGPYSIQRLIVL